MALSLCTSLLVASFFFYLGLFDHGPLISDSQEMEQLSRDSENLLQLKTLKLDKITTNLFYERNRLRYINLEVHVRPFRTRQIPQLKQIEPLIYDAILGTAGKSRPKELNSLAGKILFESEVKQKINDQLSKPLIKEIFFSSFVIQ